MKRSWLYPAAIILIVLACWLIFSMIRHGGAGNKEAQGNLVSSTMDAPEDAAGILPVQVLTDSGDSKEGYLSSLYEVNVHRNIVYASKKNEAETAEPLALDLYEPVDGGISPRPVFLFIHGGGYKEGVKEDASEISMELARRGYAVISMNYRLKSVPFADFRRTLSDAYEDIADVITWARQHEKEHGLNSGKIAIGGDSAGGYLAINFANEYLKEDPSFVKPIFALVDLYGGTLESEAHPNLPPVLMIHGTIDTMIPYEQSVALASNLDRAGIYHNLFTMEGVGHDYKDKKYFSEINETIAYFLWNVIDNAEPEWLPENTGIVASSGDRVGISLPEEYVLNADDREIRVTLPEGWALEKQTDRTKLILELPPGLQRGNQRVFIALEQYGEVLHEYGLNVNVVDPLRVGYETYFSQDEQLIKTRLQLTNQSSRDYSGVVQADYSANARAEQGSFSTKVEHLEPGQSIVLDIPELAEGKRLLSVFDALGNLVQKTEDEASVLVVPTLKQEIRIDGSLKDWSDWGEAAAFQVKDLQMNDWSGTEDISATGTICWDQKNLYFALEVIDDVHHQTDEAGEIWRGDSVQLGIGITNDDGSVPQQYHEFGLAMQDEAHLTKWRWIAPRGFWVGEPETLDFAVQRSGDNPAATFYEAAIPWTELFKGNELVHPGLKLKFSLLVNDNDGTGRKGWLEYNSGIGTSKDVNMFGDVFLAH